jgi:hypothetical protein
MNLYLKARQAVGLNPLPAEMLGLKGADPGDTRDTQKVTGDEGRIRPIDLRREYPVPIRDQGRTNRCGGFSGVSGLELLDYKQSLNSALQGELPSLTPLSANDLYWGARPDTSKDSGVFMRDLMKAMQKRGACELRYWKDHESPLRQPNFSKDAPRRKINAYERVITKYPNVAIRDVEYILSVEKLPLWVGVQLFDKVISKARHDGVMSLPQRDKSIGGHAMYLCGWKRIKRKEYFISPNSWGAALGDQGVYYIPVEYIYEGLMLDIWTVPKNYF